jgi:hypothetical protein
VLKRPEIRSGGRADLEKIRAQCRSGGRADLEKIRAQCCCPPNRESQTFALNYFEQNDLHSGIYMKSKGKNSFIIKRLSQL